MASMMRFAVFVATLATTFGMTQAEGPSATQLGLGADLIAFERKVKSESPAVYVMSPDQSGERLLTNGSQPEWSPDGAKVALVRSGHGKPEGLYVINRDGTGLRRLVAQYAPSPAWSPDGTQIVFWTTKGLALVDVASGRVRKLTRGEDDKPVWSPRADRIAFMRWQGDRFAIAAINADGTQLRVLTPALYNAHNPAWSPDGRRLAFNGNFGIGDTGYWDVYVMNADGSDLTNLTQSEAPSEEHPQWSPSGQWIAFSSTNTRRYNPDIHTIRADGTRHRNLTRSRSREDDASWSPNGRSLVFVGISDGNRDIYVMSASGGNVSNLTTDPEGTSNTNPAWSP